MKIYFLGGSFDPPHIGHFEIARYCLNHCDKFLLIPAKQSPHKTTAPIASSLERIEMLQLIAKVNPKIDIDTFEIKSSCSNYTFHTIEHLEKKYPNSKLTMVIGLDQLKRFQEWYKVKELLDKVEILCFNRDGNVDTAHKYIKLISDFKIDISSTEIRRMLHQNDPEVKKYIIPEVYKFIKRKQLYL